MLRKVAIISARQTKYEENKSDERFQEMCYPLVKECLEETGLDFVPGRGIDFAITSSDDFFDQRTISDGPMGDLVGTGRWGGEEKVATDGAMAVMYAAAGIASGHYDVEILPDEWTAITKDRSLSAHYEHTVGILEDRALILSCLDEEEGHTHLKESRYA